MFDTIEVISSSQMGPDNFPSKKRGVNSDKDESSVLESAVPQNAASKRKRKPSMEETGLPQLLRTRRSETADAVTEHLRVIETAIKGLKTSTGKIQISIERVKEATCEAANNDSATLQEQWDAFIKDHNTALEKEIIEESAARFRKEKADAIAEAEASEKFLSEWIDNLINKLNEATDEHCRKSLALEGQVKELRKRAEDAEAEQLKAVTTKRELQIELEEYKRYNSVTDDLRDGNQRDEREFLGGTEDITELAQTSDRMREYLEVSIGAIQQVTAELCERRRNSRLGRMHRRANPSYSEDSVLQKIAILKEEVKVHSDCHASYEMMRDVYRMNTKKQEELERELREEIKQRDATIKDLSGSTKKVKELQEENIQLYQEREDICCILQTSHR